MAEKKRRYVVMDHKMEAIIARNENRRSSNYRSAMLETFEIEKRADPSIQERMDKIAKEFDEE